MLSDQEKNRYSRHLNLPNFDVSHQEKLKAARVLVVGVGGLGSPVLQYLSAAGVGTVGAVDFDIVDESNLQRQVLFGTSDIGKSKVRCAIRKLNDLNPNVQFVAHEVQLRRENAREIIRPYDIVVDGTDNFPTRYLINDACVLEGKVNVQASVFRFEGQVSVFNAPLPEGGRGPNYRDLFPTPPAPGAVPSCEEGGVLGVLPGIIGAMQANEVLKVITGIGQPLVGELLVFDALTMQSRKVRFTPSADASEITELIDYDTFCGMPKTGRSITVEELREWQRAEVPFTLLDVRELHEREEFHIGGWHIPLGELSDRAKDLPRSARTVVYCKAGGRSARAIEWLGQNGFENLINLEGGMDAWQNMETVTSESH